MTSGGVVTSAPASGGGGGGGGGGGPKPKDDKGKDAKPAKNDQQAPQTEAVQPSQAQPSPSIEVVYPTPTTADVSALESSGAVTIATASAMMLVWSTLLFFW
jgi:hypothetical protein